MREPDEIRLTFGLRPEVLEVMLKNNGVFKHNDFEIKVQDGFGTDDEKKVLDAILTLYFEKNKRMPIQFALALDLFERGYNMKDVMEITEGLGNPMNENDLLSLIKDFIS